MHLRSGPARSIAILIALSMSTAMADSGGQDDAGTGGDAGDTRETAVTIQLATLYTGNKLRADDVDWYAADVPGVGASCVEVGVTVSAPAYFALGAESSDRVMAAPLLAKPERGSTGGIAGLAPMTATLRAAQPADASNLAKYNMTLERVDAAAAVGDAGTSEDAHDSIAEAFPIEPGCLAGTLHGIDLRDTFALSLVENDTITYSLGSTDPAVTVTLLDLLGNAVGATITAGEATSVSIADPGSYYLSMDRTTSVSDASYTLGTLVGPEPTGCRPYCMS